MEIPNELRDQVIARLLLFPPEESFWTKMELDLGHYHLVMGYGLAWLFPNHLSDWKSHNRESYLIAREVRGGWTTEVI